MFKKLFCCILISISLVGCSKTSVISVPQTGKIESAEETVVKTEFSHGAWLSFYEIEDLLETPEDFKHKFNTVLKNLNSLKITELYLHVRSHCDSIYKSEYFPLKTVVESYDYDVFEYIISECHKKDIKIYAWINPYRVSTDPDEEKLPTTGPVRRFFDEKSDCLLSYNGFYLNPAKGEVKKLILDGVREILSNYNVDGIHFDDYFYPTDSPDFDKESYNKYKKETDVPLPLSEWRRANVDSLISDCKTAVDTANSDTVFSISPAADIEKNREVFYADIENWIKKGYVDEIIPQLYFGFEHTDEDFCFENLITQWKKLCEKNKTVKLKIGLAAYKIGTESETDGKEWKENDDILSRQTEICFKDPVIDGIVFFSYSSLFNNQPQNVTERNNLYGVIL